VLFHETSYPPGIDFTISKTLKLYLYLQHKIFMEQLIKTILSLSEGIRYVAIYKDGKLFSSSKGNLQNASSSE
jgi:hypothetical protein